MTNRFRAFYLGALLVVGIGVVGSPLAPRAHASTWGTVASHALVATLHVAAKSAVR